MDYKPKCPLEYCELETAGESTDVIGHVVDLYDAIDSLHDQINELELLPPLLITLHRKQ